jgi:hypothetical protein
MRSNNHFSRRTFQFPAAADFVCNRLEGGCDAFVDCEGLKRLASLRAANHPGRRRRSDGFGIYHDVNGAFPNLTADPEQSDIMWPDWNVPPRAFERFKRNRTAALVGTGTLGRAPQRGRCP